MNAGRIIVACGLCLLLGFVAGRASVEPTTTVRTVRQKVYIERTTPVSVSEPIGRHLQLARLVFVRDTTSVEPVAEQVPQADSAFVELPVRDYTFSDDSTYTIVARGAYVESLPRIEFRPQTVTYEVERKRKIEHGFQIGVGAALTPHGIGPAVYAGYGVTIKF
jgi:hypothetical protein